MWIVFYLFLLLSLNYSMLSLQLSQAINLKSSQGISYVNLGEVYLSLNKTIKAIHYFEMKEGEHNLPTWGKALPYFLKWAFELDSRFRIQNV